MNRDAVGDLTMLPNFAIRKMPLGYLVAEGLEIEQSMDIEISVSQEAYEDLGEDITVKFNAAAIANGLGPVQDGWVKRRLHE